MINRFIKANSLNINKIPLTTIINKKSKLKKKSTPKHYENMDFTSFLEKKIELKNKFLTKMRT